MSNALETQRKIVSSLTYHINLDERGEFYADVRNSSGKTIFAFHGCDGLFEDGWMKHKRDTAGLLEYLRHLGLANQNSTLV